MTTNRLAGCIIVDEHGRVLLLHRCQPGKQQWEIPGGKVEPDETVPDAVIREAREELGVDIELLGHMGADNFTEDGITWRYSWMRAKIVAGTPRVCEPLTHDQIGWWHPNELAIRADLSGNTQNFVNAAQEQRLRWDCRMPPNPYRSRWHVVEDDTVGGWCVSTVDKPVSEHDWRLGEGAHGEFYSEAMARYVASLHNSALATVAATDHENVTVIPLCAQPPVVPHVSGDGCD